MNNKDFTPRKRAGGSGRRGEGATFDMDYKPQSASKKRPLSSTGFTLLELMMVILVVGVILFITAPAARDALTADHLRKASRQLIGLERKLRVDAVRDQLDYILHLDLPNAKYWITSTDMTPEKKDAIKKNARPFPEGVTITDIITKDNKKYAESVFDVGFRKNNTCTPAVIHLARKNKQMTLVINPFLGITDVYDEYVDVSIEGLLSGAAKK